MCSTRVVVSRYGSQIWARQGSNIELIDEGGDFEASSSVIALKEERQIGGRHIITDGIYYGSGINIREQFSCWRILYRREVNMAREIGGVSRDDQIEPKIVGDTPLVTPVL